ncbi:MAG: dihydrolipoamide acetyltransferase family protein [Dehalococcoidia bacterium]|nr:dihydrolipoamide acetyltransferase family protein [Dehalococcoidia bacterium]
MIIELPHVGESVTEGVIGKWLKSVGDRVERYDPLVEVVTDKVNMEMPSPVTGTLTAILVEEGDTIPMGAPIAEMDAEGAEPTSATPPTQTEPPAGVAAEPTTDRIGTLLKDVAPVGPTGSGGPISADKPADSPQPRRARRRYSPAVLRLADERNVDLDRIQGTGLNGRVTLKDVRRFLETQDEASVPTEPTAPPAPPVQPLPISADDERVSLSPVRRMIAENMVRSASQIPQAWTLVEVDVSGLVARRRAVRDDFRLREGINITYLPFIMKAVAESLKENPLLNSSWDDDAIIYKRRINIGIAAAGRDGLIVPVVHDADTLSVAGLAHKIADLTDRARRGALTLDDVQGGTFTLNNTGALGSVLSQPLVNHPQAAILTTEAIVRRPVVIGDGISIRSMMNLCMSFDHRIMDGAEASAFINSVKARIEAINPDTGLY